MATLVERGRKKGEPRLWVLTRFFFSYNVPNRQAGRIVMLFVCRKLVYKRFCMKKGFTLIELLVVVLIISILTTAAVPKYTEVMWKARTSNLLSITNSIARSHQRYYDDNYECATSLDSLDLGIGGDLTEAPSVSSVLLIDDYATVLDGRGNDDFEILLLSQRRQGCWTVGRFKKGPWAKSSFGFIHTNSTGLAETYWKQNICMEEQYYTKSNFCKKFLGTDDGLFRSATYYNLYTM